MGGGTRRSRSKLTGYVLLQIWQVDVFRRLCLIVLPVALLLRYLIVIFDLCSIVLGNKGSRS